jgi:hypothetical protein
MPARVICNYILRILRAYSNHAGHLVDTWPPGHKGLAQQQGALQERLRPLLLDDKMRRYFDNIPPQPVPPRPDGPSITDACGR